VAPLSGAKRQRVRPLNAIVSCHLMSAPVNRNKAYRPLPWQLAYDFSYGSAAVGALLIIGGTYMLMLVGAALLVLGLLLSFVVMPYWERKLEVREAREANDS